MNEPTRNDQKLAEFSGALRTPSHFYVFIDHEAANGSVLSVNGQIQFAPPFPRQVTWPRHKIKKITRVSAATPALEAGFLWSPTNDPGAACFVNREVLRESLDLAIKTLDPTGTFSQETLLALTYSTDSSILGYFEGTCTDLCWAILRQLVKGVAITAEAIHESLTNEGYVVTLTRVIGNLNTLGRCGLAQTASSTEETYIIYPDNLKRFTVFLMRLRHYMCAGVPSNNEEPSA